MSFWGPVENPRTRRRRSWAFDIGCAMFACVASLGRFSFAQTPHPVQLPLAASLVVAVVTSLALPLRRVWPGPVFLWTALAAAVLGQWPVRGALFPVALAIALYTVAATMRRPQALVAALLVVGVVLPAPALDGWHDIWLPAIYEITVTVAVLAAGLYVSARRAYLAALHDRARRLERERDQNSALAAAAERARIAREMHDSVAHHLTVIVALSDGALAALARAPGEAAGAMRDVSGTARQALAETRRLLGVLRSESGPELRQPLPGLADLDDLLSRVRAAGLPVRLERSGTGADPSADVQLAVFRLVQEALTNTMKHAGQEASAAVRLRLTPAEICVEVDDDGAGAGGAAEPGAPGGGLTGMRERISAFGGELACGPRQPRGWRVTASIRIDTPAAS